MYIYYVVILTSITYTVNAPNKLSMHAERHKFRNFINVNKFSQRSISKIRNTSKYPTLFLSQF